jgi:phage FluMu protein Com
MSSVKVQEGELTNFPEDIYVGLQVPKKQNALKKSVKEVIIKKKMTDEEIEAKEGKYFDEDDIEIYDEDVDVYTEGPEGEKILLAKLRKSVLDPEVIKTGWEGFWITAAPSRNRGAAAGPIAVNGKYWKKRNPMRIQGHSAYDGKMRVNNNVFSSVLGYFDATPFMKLPCRLTTYTMRYWKYYKHGLPFIRAIDKCFATLVPDRYKLQRAAAEEKPFLHITDTAFSSVTINRNFRTALHRDAGDFREGYGNLSVIERGEYHGGFTLFPQYGIGFNVRTGDFLAMDVHQWHCNTELYETEADKKANKDLPNIHKDNQETGTLGSEKVFSRVSFVCYLREKLRQCKNNETRKYFQKIGYNSKSGKFAQKGGPKGTRKKTDTQTE